MILAYHAVADIRWDSADIARSNRVANEADAALLRYRERIRVADALATRAGLGPRFSHLR
ncbi:hypothetical protein MKK64_06755 [Methylobacterium sp. E-025]|uniref:hypothetical protein n=1 Tax=Methylobacterium sp. E-025 TaxID=2836561 RepID=UPI001FB9A6A4|nr:hypothetical protein [Methylobacterium sp. E-025]MCJ2110899.1 hypothetical protein [Methylobacterium sp. E-025]